MKCGVGVRDFLCRDGVRSFVGGHHSITKMFVCVGTAGARVVSAHSISHEMSISARSPLHGFRCLQSISSCWNCVFLPPPPAAYNNAITSFEWRTKFYTSPRFSQFFFLTSGWSEWKETNIVHSSSLFINTRSSDSWKRRLSIIEFRGKTIFNGQQVGCSVATLLQKRWKKAGPGPINQNSTKQELTRIIRRK